VDDGVHFFTVRLSVCPSVCLSHVTYFFKFRDPQISLERLEIQTANFVCGLTVRNAKPKNRKMVKTERGLGHVTYLSNFENPLISLERLKKRTANFAFEWSLKDTIP